MREMNFYKVRPPENAMKYRFTYILCIGFHIEMGGFGVF